MSIELLLEKQNRDGGWPYVRGASWTEPTAYATLALLDAEQVESAGRGLRWIRAMQRRDGGWPPQAGVDQSSWVTAAVALLPPRQLGVQAHGRAIRWLLATAGEESSLIYRLRQRLLGVSISRDEDYPGWPWLPGTAAWVGPTSLAILALEKQFARTPLAALRERIESGRRFLINRACVEGGWNHGSQQALGYDSRPYPETTGIALAALRGERSPVIDRGIEAASQFLAECRSADALNWLRLGLAAHGRMPAGYCPPAPLVPRTLPEASLDMLVASAERGNSLFWS